MRILKKMHFSFFLSRWLSGRDKTKFDNIVIFSFEERGGNYEKVFEQRVIAALQLIKETTPKYYHRIQEYVSTIIQMTKPEQNTYIIREKMGILDISVQWRDTQLMHIYYAGILIYMSTYGYLMTKTSNEYMEDILKVYHICLQAEERFYRKVEEIYPEYKDTLVDKFTSLELVLAIMNAR